MTSLSPMYARNHNNIKDFAWVNKPSFSQRLDQMYKDIEAQLKLSVIQVSTSSCISQLASPRLVTSMRGYLAGARNRSGFFLSTA